MKSVPGFLFRSFIFVSVLTLSACGGSGGGKKGPQQPPPDLTAPTVSAVSAPATSTLNRTVTLTATASDASGIAEVRFLLDGVLLGSDTTSPYSFDWDTSMATDGDHVLAAEARDMAGNTARSGDITVTIANLLQFVVALSGEQENPAVSSAGSAQADFSINLVSGAVTGGLTVNGFTPTAAHIHDGFAGNNGGVLIGLTQDAVDPLIFAAPAAAALDATGVDKLLAGRLYVNVHSAAHPSGEIRAQLLPADFVLKFATLSGSESVPQVDSLAGGRAALTLNQATGDLVVQVRLTGLDDATNAHVHEAYAGKNGGVLVGLTKDAVNPARWYVEDGTLSAAGLDAFNAGRLYVNVHSAAFPGGEIRGQVVPDNIQLIFAEVNGLQEVPANDSRATALAAITLDATASIITIHTNTSGIDDASNAHLHNAYGGVNGGVRVGLVQDGGNPAHWFAEEQPLDAATLAAVLAGATYVNVHSPALTAGEIRGQVIPDGILFTHGAMSGNQEVPAVGNGASGRFAVTVDPVAMTLVAHVNTTGADDANAAHLHTGYAGISGGVSIPLAQDAVTLSRWSAANVALSAAQLDAFNAGRLYANVHTPAHPSGAIRGQLTPAPIEVVFTNLSSTERVPEIASAASAIAATTINRETGLLTLYMTTTGADDATAAHFHSAYAGDNGGVAIGLTKDAVNPARWSAVEVQADAADLADLLDGRFYINVHTPANPSGEIRGQVVPRDIQLVFSNLDGDQVVPPVVSAASGKVATTVNLRSRNFVAFLNNLGADDATSAGIYTGGVGVNGAELLPLGATAGVLSRWSAMTDLTNAADFGNYRAGGLYALVTTPAHATGELRGQIEPPDAALFDNQAPTVTLNSPGATVTGTVTLEASASDDRGVSLVRFLVDGVVIATDTAAPFSYEWDSTGVPNGDVTLTAEAEDAAGNVGTSADVNVTVDNPIPVTLTQIQNTVFTPICSGCHTGPTGNTLPGGMNLTSAANSYDALVNEPSLQVALNRVTPGNANDSYLIRKLEGGPNIVLSRMPQGGPFLDQATIDMIRQWINDGAANN